MSEQPDNVLRIYLHELAEKDAAVITRVINFSSAQGKPYVLHVNPAESHILVVTGDTPVRTQNPIPIIRIHHQVLASHELLLAPPLLVTRVMRIIDEAALRLKAPIASPAPVTTNPPPASPAPATLNAPDKKPDTVLPKPETIPPAPSIEPISPPSSAEIVSPNPTIPSDKASAKPSDSPPASPPVAPTAPSKTNAPLALIIDDSLAIRTQLAIELRNMNIACEQAETGEQGLALLEQKNYHMIFLDIIMPGMDGYEVCKQIRQRPATRKTPIVMLSGKDTPLDEVKGILAGATTYLTKPVNPERLQQTIGRIARWIAEFS